MSVRSTSGQLISSAYAAQGTIAIGGWGRLQVNRNDFSCLMGMWNAGGNEFAIAETDGTGLAMFAESDGPGTGGLTATDALTVGQWFYFVVEANATVLNAFWLNGGGIGTLNTATAVTAVTLALTLAVFFDENPTGFPWNGDLVNVKMYNALKGSIFWRNQMGRRLPLTTSDLIGDYRFLDINSYLSNWRAGNPNLTASGTALTTSASPPIAGM